MAATLCLAWCCASAEAQQVADAGPSSELPGVLFEDRAFLKAQNACLRPAFDELCAGSNERKVSIAVSAGDRRSQVVVSSEKLKAATRAALGKCIEDALEKSPRRIDVPLKFNYWKAFSCSQ